MPSFEDAHFFGYNKDFFVYTSGPKIHAMEIFGTTPFQERKAVFAHIDLKLKGKKWQGDACWNVTCPIIAVQKVLNQVGRALAEHGYLDDNARYKGEDGSVVWLGNGQMRSRVRRKPKPQAPVVV